MVPFVLQYLKHKIWDFSRVLIFGALASYKWLKDMNLNFCNQLFLPIYLSENADSSFEV